MKKILSLFISVLVLTSCNYPYESKSYEISDMTSYRKIDSVNYSLTYDSKVYHSSYYIWTLPLYAMESSNIDTCVHLICTQTIGRKRTTFSTVEQAYYYTFTTYDGSHYINFVTSPEQIFGQSECINFLIDKKALTPISKLD